MVRLERASVHDAGLFAAMEQAEGAKPYVLPYSESEHARRMLAPDTIYLRIVSDDALAGFIILVLDPEPNSVEFRRIVISAKGQGIGQSAIVAMERFCRAELRRTRVWLDVFEHNSRARHVYEKHGYERRGELHHEGRRLLLYEKQL